MNMPKWDKLLEKLENLSSNLTRSKNYARFSYHSDTKNHSQVEEVAIIHIARETRK